MEMTLNLLDNPFSVTYQEREDGTSLATGRPVRRRSIGLVVGEQLVDELSDRLGEAADYGSGEPKPLLEPDGTAWLVTNYDLSYSMQNSGTTFDVDLIEAEPIPDVHRIRIDDLEPFEVLWSQFDPTGSKDETTAVWLVDAVVPATAVPHVDELHAPSAGYFDLQLEGVRDGTLRARTGRPGWQPGEDSSRIYHLVLVCDEENPLTYQQTYDDIRLDNLSEEAAVDHEILNGVVEALIKAGHLTREAVDDIRAEAVVKAEANSTQRYRVNDVTTLH